MINIVMMVLLLISLLFPAQNGMKTDFKELLQKIDSAVRENNRDKAFYYMARYLGFALYDDSIKYRQIELETYFYKLELLPVSFISGQYDKYFLAYFFNASYKNWVQMAHRKEFTDEDRNSSVITLADDGNYYVGIEAYPILETWSIVGTPEGTIYKNIAALIDYERKPRLFVGSIANQGKDLKEYYVDTGGLCCQYFWPPKLIDINKDGKVEIIVRYNVVRADGFFQQCDVYRIDENSIILLDSLKGDPEGVARHLLDNAFEAAHCAPSQDQGHLFFDKHIFKKYVFENDKFREVPNSSQTVENILWSKEFKKYYLD